MTVRFASVRAVILDMDGVLWRGSQPLPGVAAFFEFVQAQGLSFALATNNSTQRVDTYVDKLNRLGIPARPEQVITSAVATADYIARHYDPAEFPVYVIGGAGIRHALAEQGFREDPEQARLVVVGMDFDITFEKLTVATLRIRDGATFIGTNGDRTFPIPEGLAPGNGSFLALLETSTEVTPLIIGKPEKAMFDVALERLGVAPDEALMVGDRLETDIVGANRAGLQSALVLTGITSAEMARQSAIPMNGVFENLDDLRVSWQAAIAR